MVISVVAAMVPLESMMKLVKAIVLANDDAGHERSND